MNSSGVDDRILQALLEIAGEKFGAEIEGHLERRDSDGRNMD